MQSLGVQVSVDGLGQPAHLINHPKVLNFLTPEDLKNVVSDTRSLAICTRAIIATGFGAHGSIEHGT